MLEHKWTYIVDLDEFIVPKLDHPPASADDLVRGLEELKRSPKDRRSDSFLFRNTFFCSEFNPTQDLESDFNIFNIENRQVPTYTYL